MTMSFHYEKMKDQDLIGSPIDDRDPPRNVSSDSQNLSQANPNQLIAPPEDESPQVPDFENSIHIPYGNPKIYSPSELDSLFESSAQENSSKSNPLDFHVGSEDFRTEYDGVDDYHSYPVPSPTCDDSEYRYPDSTRLESPTGQQEDTQMISSPDGGTTDIYGSPMTTPSNRGAGGFGKNEETSSSNPQTQSKPQSSNEKSYQDVGTQKPSTSKPSANQESTSRNFQFSLLSNQHLKDVAMEQYDKIYQSCRPDILTSDELYKIKERYHRETWNMMKKAGFEEYQSVKIVPDISDNIRSILRCYSEVSIYSKAVSKSSNWRLTWLSCILGLEVLLYNILNIKSAKGLYDVHFQSMFLYDDDIDQLAYENVQSSSMTQEKKDPKSSLIQSFCIVTVIYLTLNMILGGDNEQKVQSIFQQSTHMYYDIHKNNSSVLDTISKNKDTVSGILKPMLGKKVTPMVTNFLGNLTQS